MKPGRAYTHFVVITVIQGRRCFPKWKMFRLNGKRSRGMGTSDGVFNEELIVRQIHVINKIRVIQSLLENFNKAWHNLFL